MRIEQDHFNTLPNEADISGDLLETIDDTTEKLKALGDHLRVKLHLAGMEAKELKGDLLDTVESLGRRLSDYAGTLGKTKDEAEVQMHLGLMEARKHWEITKEHAGQALELIKEDKDKAKAFLQQMRLQAQLAKAETKESLQNTRSELGDNFREISQQGSSALKKMNKSVGEFLQSLS